MKHSESYRNAQICCIPNIWYTKPQHLKHSEPYMSHSDLCTRDLQCRSVIKLVCDILTEPNSIAKGSVESNEQDITNYPCMKHSEQERNAKETVQKQQPMKNTLYENVHEAICTIQKHTRICVEEISNVLNVHYKVARGKYLLICSISQMDGGIAVDRNYSLCSPNQIQKVVTWDKSKVRKAQQL